MRWFTVLTCLVVCGTLIPALHTSVSSQAPTPPPKRGPEELLRLSKAAGGPGLAEPFKGITAKGEVENGLFSIKSIGVSTEPVRKAAEAFPRWRSLARRGRSARLQPRGGGVRRARLLLECAGRTPAAAPRAREWSGKPRSFRLRSPEVRRCVMVWCVANWRERSVLR